MSRVGYLAALGGGAGPVAAPSLRPPRRPFPHEPALDELPRAQPERTIDAPPPLEQPVRVQPTSVPPPAAASQAEPVAEPAAAPATPAERVPLDPGRLPVPASRARSTAPPETPALRRPQADAIQPPSRLLPAHAAVTQKPPRAEPRPVARALEPAAVEPAPRGHTVPPSPAPAAEPPSKPPVLKPHRELALAAAETHRPPVQLEPPHSRPEPALRQPRTPTPPLRTADAGVPQLHIGTIEVTVVPPPPPPAPAQPQARTVVTRPVSTVAWRSGGTARWFGLAQR